MPVPLEVHFVNHLRLPLAVANRLQNLLDRKDAGEELSSQERQEAAGLFDLDEFLSMLRLQVQRKTS